MVLESTHHGIPTTETRRPCLVRPNWLAQHLHDPAVRVVEVDVSPAAYDEWHVDGAVLWNVYQDLKDAEYRLIDPLAFGKLLARSGIGPGSTVVLYGYAPALGLWLLELYGHTDVRILDCSRQTWLALGHPTSNAAPLPAPTAYPISPPDRRLRADAVVVRRAITDPDVTLLDVRTAAEYEGERFWPSGGMEPGGRAGHIPTAVRQTLDGCYDDDGAFRTPDKLRQLFTAIDLSSENDVITYCTIGGRAATAWFVLTHLLGRPNVMVYDGSWAEWGRIPDVPVATA